ncbi:MAG: RecQ family ATP-dependent DNA helicase [Nitrospira sp. SB0677_bin_15]|nr:RecQ family ATP-dependent DNA helicase [Nitrospira sp. SB0677_bin_15]
MPNASFSPRCLSLDLEVGIRDRRIHAFAAVRSDSDQPLIFRGGDLAAALAKLDDFAADADFLLGHNLIAFDLLHLAAARSDLRVLTLPAVDTLKLNPLAFPRHPYHHLVKHYQDGQLKRGRLNDPELDARLTLEVFHDQWRVLQDITRNAPDRLLAWHWLTTAENANNAFSENEKSGFGIFFSTLRRSQRPADAEAHTAIRNLLTGNVCLTYGREILTDTACHGWAMAYALAWLSVSGGNSVMPPWVRHQFPDAGRLVRRLRDTACGDLSCDWCQERHNARKELKRWFGFPGFRPEPADEDGRPMQQAIVEAAMTGEHVLGILPTGTGKSLCYQIPALSRYDKTSALTVVISPLVALMADQVAGLEARGIGSCVAINGLLSMPERVDALDRVRLGDAGILIVSPEQLRSRSLVRVLNQREIGAWVLDEAHCLSKWGHDFRPDYRYVGRFIRENAGSASTPPVLCLTATAKPEVKEDIRQHFRDELGIGLKVFDGGAQRTNLDFLVVPTTGGEKLTHLHQILMSDLPPDIPGGAIVYCATRRQTEEVAEFLRMKGVAADYFHAKLPPETKKNVQQRFIDGELRVIVATNAFGMGIDKPDVRLVLHADIPGSLENYLQEAGRAGRDSQTARCVLLYATDDVERQFGMSARSRLTRREIQVVLRALRNLDRKKRPDGEVVATAGEILVEDEEKVFERDSATDDTRVRTAIAWLEEAGLLKRHENRVQVLPSSLMVNSVEEARARLERTDMADVYRRKLLTIAETLIDADPDEGISTDELMGVSGLSPEEVRGALHDLEQLGIARNDTALTAFVHEGVARSSQKRFNEAVELEIALIEHLRQAAPDMSKGDTSILHLRVAAQTLRDSGLTDPLPEKLWRILRSIAHDGRGEESGIGSFDVRQQDMETVRVTLQREWSALEEIAARRREGAKLLLDHLLACLPPRTRGTDLLAETTHGKLLDALTSDIILKSSVRNPQKLLNHALLWLHDQEIIRLHKRLAVFRPAMTIRLVQETPRRGFAVKDFQPLKLHYQGQVRQIHVMVEFARRGLDAMADALRLIMDYFSLKEELFLHRWLPDRLKEIERQTTPESWRAIVESLKNPIQQRIVTDDRDQTNVLVLAGPGSGKTRVLVHRITYLVRARRENPRSILALAYNRHAAVEIRRRLGDLIGNDARGITVLTCHGLAMRLAGVSFQERERRQLDDQAFREVLRQAVALLRGEGLEPEEADDQRERLLAGFRWILVDEYQDIGADQYELISALAGRTLNDEDRKLTLFAVGDDDQNIYAFTGASVEFIRRFEADYRSKPIYLTDNYRSTGHIISAANALIEPSLQRMKTGHPIRINRAREKDSPGGAWRELDPVAQGRVQILPAQQDSISQARVAMTELQRLAAFSPNWNWSTCAVIAREWEYLNPVRAFCEAHGIPAQMANEDIPRFWRLRETRALVESLHGRNTRLVDGATLRAWLDTASPGPWIELLREAVDEYVLETGGAEMPVDHFIEWLAEWGREIRRRQRGLLLLTAHSAKGLEFDHVAVLDGGWERVDHDEDPDSPRRLYYVAVTRARQTLALASFSGSHPLQDALRDSPAVLRREPAKIPPATPELARQYRRPDLNEIDLGFAGRHGGDHPVHRAIAALSPDDPLKARVNEKGRWELLNQSGMVVGRLANNFRSPPGTRCSAATVLAIVVWNREASAPEYRDVARCDTWEMVVPELVFDR